jgi:hypothetical protein
MGTSS